MKKKRTPAEHAAATRKAKKDKQLDAKLRKLAISIREVGDTEAVALLREFLKSI